jgi:hypothetical protein
VTAVATPFALPAGSACAGEVVDDFLLAAGVTLAADTFRVEETNLAEATFGVCSVERGPVLLFPPVVFAIASPFRLC